MLKLDVLTVAKTTETVYQLRQPKAFSTEPEPGERRKVLNVTHIRVTEHDDGSRTVDFLSFRTGRWYPAPAKLAESVLKAFGMLKTPDPPVPTEPDPDRYEKLNQLKDQVVDALEAIGFRNRSNDTNWVFKEDPPPGFIAAKSVDGWSNVVVGSTSHPRDGGDRQTSLKTYGQVLEEAGFNVTYALVDEDGRNPKRISHLIVTPEK